MNARPHQHEFEDVKREIDARIDEVLARLRIDVPAKKSGTILIDDPRKSGKGNFAIWIKSDGLSWKNYTTDERGRALELIAYINGWYHLNRRGAKEAKNWAVDALGLGRVSTEQLELDRELAREAIVKARSIETEILRRKRGAAYFTFTKESVPILCADGAETGAAIYLRVARGIDLRADPFIGPRGGIIAPHALRFKARHKYVHRDSKGRKYRETFHPAMIACCVDADMKIAAIHQTYLRDDFSDKADLEPAPDGQVQNARKVWPDSAGCVIPLWRGEGNFSPKEAEAIGLLQTLALTEGVEDGLSAVLAAPANRTWGAISLSNIVNVAARLPACCDSIIIHRQNDWLKAQAVAQFERGMDALRATGNAVAEVGAVHGKDLNDTLRGD